MSKPDVSTDAEAETKVETSVKSGEIVRSTKRRTSISTKIVARILPLIVLPLLAIGIISVGAIALIQSRTDDAVAAAEALLTTEVVEDGVNRSADRASREVGELINEMVEDVENLSNRREVGLAIDDANETLSELRFGGRFNNIDQLRAALVGTPALVGTSFADGLADDLAIGENIPEVTLVSESGVQLANTSGSPATLVGDTEWFKQTIESESGLWINPFVVDDSGRESFEIAQRSTSFAATNVVGVVRVRVPLVAIQDLLDEIILDSGAEVQIAMIDADRGFLLAETATNHDPEFLYEAGMIAGGAMTVDEQLLEPGTTEDDEFLTSARTVNSVGGAAESFDWLVQVRQPIDIATAPLAQVRQVSDDVGSTRSLVSFGMLSLIVVALYVGWRSTTRIARRITDPVRYLSSQAQSAATEGIPLIVEAAEHSEEELPELKPFHVDTDDELSVLADSLNIMQSAAVGLAAGQAKLRRQNVARTFVSLGRRNQNLLNRQLEFIDDLERAETDPDTLENLFRLDHLATRMRRNAENLLVLAGEQTPRRWGKPIALRDVLQAAASEIADFKRVRIGDIDDATVSGSVATDISHLVAELLENAGSFSPPTAPIDVVGQRTPTHYRLAIMDQGIGMDDGALAQANHRLANPVDFADAPSAYIGLFVVGHLGRQLDVRVRLAKSEPVNLGEGSGNGGTIAFVDLPNALLTTDAPTAIDFPARTRRREGSSPFEEATFSVAAPVEDFDQAALADALEVPEPVYGENSTPAVTDWNVPPTPAPSQVEQLVEPDVTVAGFPKRRRSAEGAAPVDLAPVSHAAPVESPPISPLPTGPEIAGSIDPGPPEVTDAGFPRRTRSEQPVAEATKPEATSAGDRAPITRDASSVRASLVNFSAAVARGRDAASAGGTPSPAPAGATPSSPVNPPTQVNQPPSSTPTIPTLPVNPSPLSQGEPTVPGQPLTQVSPQFTPSGPSAQPAASEVDEVPEDQLPPTPVHPSAQPTGTMP